MFGTALGQLRQARGIGLRMLARKSGLSHGFICDIEKNRTLPSLPTFRRLVCALELGTQEEQALLRALMVAVDDHRSLPKRAAIGADLP